MVDTLVQAKDLSPDTWRFFSHVTVDTLGRHIYWTDSGGTLPDGTVYIGAIMRASLDGDNPEIVLGGIICGIGAPSDIELDPGRNMLYWGESSDCPFVALNRIDLESSDPVLSSLPTNGNYSVSGIALDIRNQMIYWTNTDFFVQEPHGILRAPLSDTASEEYIVTGSVCDIALAHTLSKIYWTPCSLRFIRRANLDGTEVEDVIVSQGIARTLAIDHKGQKIYWTEPSEGVIRRANLDGTEVEELLSGLVVPGSIALSFGGEISTAVEPAEEFPDTVELQDIYPNPVEGRATFAFVLTEPAHVTLEIYDQLGRRVALLASRTYPPGQFSVEWNPTGQSNGVYFFRMTSDNRSKTIPLVLQR